MSHGKNACKNCPGRWRSRLENSPGAQVQHANIVPRHSYRTWTEKQPLHSALCQLGLSRAAEWEGFRRDRAADVGVSGSTRILSHGIHTIHGQKCKPPPCSVSTRDQSCRRVAGFRRDRAADVGLSGSLSAGLHLAMPATQNL